MQKWCLRLLFSCWGLILRPFARLTLLICLFTAGGMTAAQNLVLDPGSPFFQELHAEPVPQDPAEILVKVALLGRTRNSSDGVALVKWLDRTRIMALLGEPLAVPKTISEAIALEKSAKETFEDLFLRAMNSQLVVERATDSTVGSFQYNGRIAYLGNSVWQGGATNRRLWIRMKVESRSTRPINVFGIAIPHPTDPRGKLDFWRCTFDGGESLAPQATRYALCQDDLDIDKSPAAVQAISADVLALPIRVTRIEMPEIRLVGHNSTLPENNDRLPKASRQAEEILARTPCERVNSCAQVAQLAAREAERRYEASPEYFQKMREERHARSATKLTLGFALMLALTFGFAAMPKVPEVLADGRIGSVAVAGIFPLGVVALAGAIPVMLEWPAAVGYGGYLFLIPAMGAGLLLGILVAALGLTLLDRARRTRLRLAAVGFGLGALGILASAFVS